MVRKLAFGIVALAVVVLACTSLMADDGKNEYIGDSAKRCVLCHKEQVEAWQEWDIAATFDRLEGEERTDEACIACHVTGYGEEGGFVSEKETPELMHVQCEACHGPAGNHMKAPLTDKEKKRETINGHPGEDNCLICHIEEGNPNYIEFNYEEALEAIANHLPEEESEAEPETEPAAEPEPEEE
jgi:hypothetical protein